MAAAFGAIGNSGLYLEPLSFSKVTDAQGNVILDASAVRTQTQAFKPSTAYMLVDMLTNAVQSGTGTSAKIAGITVAGKTGTVQDYKGVYFTGITPYYSASVWIGTDDYKIGLRSGSTGGGYAAPLWKAFMTKALAGLPNKAIIAATPESLGLVKVTTCSVSGKLATEACAADPDHQTVTDWWLDGTQPTEKCDLHVLVDVCTESNKLATEHCPATSVTKRGYLVAKANSILSNAPINILKQYLNIKAETSSPEDYCTIHTSESTSQNAAIVSDANAAVTEATNYLSANKSKMTTAQQTSLSTDISNVQTQLAASPINYSALKLSADSLKSTLATIKAAVSAAPTSTPTPTTP